MTSKAANNEAFVREYQRRRGLHVDGWAGPEARADLDKLMPPETVRAKSLKYPPQFFAVVRGHFKTLTGDQVVGIETLLKAMKDWPISWVAYGLATADIETAHTFEPVREAYYLGAKAEAWRKKNLRYYPHYGRGYVQITWLKNYQWLDKASAEAGLTEPGEILADLDLALRPDIAALALRLGLEEGRYDAQGKRMADRLPVSGNATRAQFVNARYLVNIQDKAGPIADVALMFQRALIAGEWS